MVRGNSSRIPGSTVAPLTWAIGMVISLLSDHTFRIPRIVTTSSPLSTETVAMRCPFVAAAGKSLLLAITSSPAQPVEDDLRHGPVVQAFQPADRGVQYTPHGLV